MKKHIELYADGTCLVIRVEKSNNIYKNITNSSLKRLVMAMMRKGNCDNQPIHLSNNGVNIEPSLFFTYYK